MILVLNKRIFRVLINKNKDLINVIVFLCPFYSDCFFLCNKWHLNSALMLSILKMLISLFSIQHLLKMSGSCDVKYKFYLKFVLILIISYIITSVLQNKANYNLISEPLKFLFLSILNCCNTNKLNTYIQKGSIVCYLSSNISLLFSLPCVVS
jgi:hypothetical protein